MSGTNLGKMPILIVSLVIGIVMATTAIVPLVSDYSEAKTFTNEGYFRMTHYDDTTDHVISWTYEDPSIITVDNEDIEIDYKVPSGQVSVIIDTNFLVRMMNDSNGNVSGVAIVTSSGNASSAYVANSQNATITLSSGTMSATFGTSTKSGTYTDIYVPSDDGPFIMKDFSKGAYILPDSDLVAFGLTRLNTANGTESNPGTGLSFIGNYEDGINGSVWRGSNVSLSDIELNTEEVSSHKDLYKMESITATATYTETVDNETVTTDTAVTYNYLLVPYEVTAIPDNPDTYKALVKVIPVMAFVALIAAAAFMIYSKRD